LKSDALRDTILIEDHFVVEGVVVEVNVASNDVTRSETGTVMIISYAVVYLGSYREIERKNGVKGAYERRQEK
jgi:hypothetical protein